LKDPTAREKLLRGQYLEATRQLVERQDFYSSLNRTDTKTAPVTPEVIDRWVALVNTRYKDLATAKLPDFAARLPEAQRAVDELWQSNSGIVGKLVEQAIAEAGRAEACYQLAMIAHERAEISQRMADRVADWAAANPNDGPRAKAAEIAQRQARTDWLAAQGNWNRYQEFVTMQDTSFPGRGVHTKKLIERAKAAATE
jgi:predicted TIM-barrel fold metal-dependent hydrolase